MTNKERFIELLNFNPRSHERSDGHRGKQRTCIRYFNPRSHERSDRADRGHQKDDGHFNPRSHERSDWYTQAGTVKATEISIHAPTRGATLGLEIFNSDGSIFQSTLPREERPIQRLPSWPERYFNPRSHERSDSSFCFSHCLIVNFNPRSHERSDSNIAQKICLFLYNTDNKYIIR